MRALDLIQKLQAIVDEYGDQNVGMTTVGPFATSDVKSVRVVDSDKVCPGPGSRIIAILVSDYEVSWPSHS